MSEFDTPENEQMQINTDEEPDGTIEENSIVEDDEEIDEFLENEETDSQWITYSDDEEVCDENTNDAYEESEDVYDETDAETEVGENRKEHFRGLKLYLAGKIYEFNSLTKKQRTTRTTVFFAVLIFLILVMTDIIPILPNSYHRAYVGNDYVLGETVGSDVEKYGAGVIYATDGTVICFGPDMEIKKKISTFSGIPQINTKGESAIVYTKNGNNFLVMKNKDKYEMKAVNENIYSAKINADSDYILLTSEAGYKSCLTAYSSDHKLIYEWHTNKNVLDMAFSDNQNYIATSTIEFGDSGINTKLLFIETTTNTPISEYVIENQVISEVFYTHDNMLVAIGDTSAYGFTATGHQKWEIKYDGKNLKTYDYDEDGKIAFLFNKYNSELSESTIEIYSPSGRMRGKYESEENVTSISINNGYCLLLIDKGTALLDDGADLRKKKELKEDYQKIVLFDNYNFAFGIRDNIAEILSVKH